MLRNAGGAGQIALERDRQVCAEGWTPEHDSQWQNNELLEAAMCYASITHPSASADEGSFDSLEVPWPWSAAWWKPSDDPIRNLEKAGALIAAEIDRLQQSSA